MSVSDPSLYVGGAVKPSDIPPSARGNAKIDLLSCPRCPDGTPVHWLNLLKSYSWCISVSCSSCSDSWFCCTLCDYSRLSRFPDVNRRTRHHSRYHIGQKKMKSLPSGEVSAAFNDDSENLDSFPSDFFQPPQFSQLLSDVSVPPCERHFSILGNPCSTRFFHQEVIDAESGIRCLIAKSQFGLPSLGYHVSDDDVDVQLLLADFVLGLTNSQRRVFPVLLRKIMQMPEYCSGSKPFSDSSFTEAGSVSQPAASRFLCKAPMDFRYLRSTYVEGKDALIFNLPRPRVTGLAGHSYMSLREIVAHHLAFSSPEELTCWDNRTVIGDGHPIKSIFECSIAQQAFTEAQSVNHFCTTLPVLFTKWSDDFEPNSQAKQNRGSAWVCTITFCLPSGCARPSTYVLSLGDKDLDHSVVESEFNREYNDLTSGEQWFYHGGAKTAIRCHVFLLASLKDQPERRKGCFISLGNGRFTSRWGYCADINSTRHLLPSCRDCRLGLATNRVQGDASTCDQCANWDFNSPLLGFPPPLHFPVADLDDGTTLTNGHLFPRMLTFERLIDVTQKARDNYANARWDGKQTTAYLSIFGLNVEFCNFLMDAVDNEEPFVIPPMWCQHRNMQCLIDVPMHLLGLGISKAIHQSIVWVWLVQRRLRSSFTRNVAGKLESVYSLKLSWCKAFPAKSYGNLSGWVSENHFAWARICRWYCSCLCELTEDAPYAAPTKPVARYTIKECKEWLRAHGVGFNGLTRVLDLRNRIISSLHEDPTIQASVGPAGGPASNIGDVLCTMVKLFSLCLGPIHVDDTLPNLVDHAVKVFLNAVELADAELRVPNSKPIWYSKYNFLSLLNLRDTIKHLGLPRWYWEGGPAGEGILRVVKPLVSGGLRPGWAEPAHRAYCARMAIGQVRRFSNCATDSYDGDSDRDEDDEFVDNAHPTSFEDLLLSKFILRDCRAYPSFDKARWQMRNGRPLCGVVVRDNRMFIAVKSRHDLSFHEVIVADRTDTKLRMGMTYYPFTILPTSIEASGLPQCEDCCLLLPFDFSTALDEMASAYYSVISKDWKELCPDGVFRLC